MTPLLASVPTRLPPGKWPRAQEAPARAWSFFLVEVCLVSACCSDSLDGLLRVSPANPALAVPV